jgi:hypothetical protein
MIIANENILMANSFSTSKIINEIQIPTKKMNKENYIFLNQLVIIGEIILHMKGEDDE